METAAVQSYGTGGCGSDWKLQQCDVTAPVAGVQLETAALRYYGTGGCESDWKLQKCDVTAPVAGG